MKSTKIITGCALAVGLMAFASTNVQADSATSGNIVVGNQLYSPINVKMTVKYVADNGQIKQATATSKDLLEDLGFNTGQVKLTLDDNLDVNVVNKKTGSVVDVSNVGEEMYGMWVDVDQQLNTEKVSGNNDQNVKIQSEGQAYLDFYGQSSDFYAQGLYSATLSYNYQNNGSVKVTDSAKTLNLSGSAWVDDLGSDLPASGKLEGSGNGKLTYVE